jgi:N utilization substance protein A
MKSEFMLAFNEICEQRGLPKEVVIDALKTALVSAYRRNMNVSNTQQIRVEIDQRTGEPTIFAEKEVVDSIFDDRTEVLLSDAQRRGFPEAELGEMVMVESTPRNFGRIAAQTAKQVILQRVREAEREQLFEDFSGREGEIVNGTVQSIGGQHITIGLGRTEAILPKSQQVPGERYRAHDKIRVYMLEVRRTNRGPQILVSRNHRNLLRRLLELEVPEIYNGQVDIKSIAREAGARSKVAVVALQPGVDPVGACVGMRGVRIQSIVRELNDEKIDVIEWDPDQRTFISKALSPARVSQVYLEDHPDEGKTAVVIVPDDQLSLAIGREGQNARLAAKLTGWRIDIKSLTEAATDSLARLNDPAADKRVARDKELVEKVQHVLAKKEASRPITAEDYMVLDRFVAGVEGRIIAERAVSHEQLRKERVAARKRVPKQAWDLELEELDLPLRLHNLLLEHEIVSVGDVMYHLEIGDASLLAIDGVGDKALEVIKEAMAELQQQLAVTPPAGEVAEAEEAEVTEEAAAVELVIPEAEEAVEAELVEAAEEIIAAEEPALAEEPPVEEALPEAEELPAEEVLLPGLEVPIDDLSTPLVPTQPEIKPKPEKKVVVVARTGPAEEEVDRDDAAGRSHKGKQLVFDEDHGRVVVKRKRKGSRRRPEWEQIDDLDPDF